MIRNMVAIPSLPGMYMWTPKNMPPAPHSLRRDAQFLVERLRTRLPAQELHQRQHLVLGASLLQHGVAIPPALSAVHGILLEDRVEHVGRVYQRREVAVVAGIVPADQVAKGRLAVAPGAARVRMVSGWDR